MSDRVIPMMNRREALALGAGVAAAVVAGWPVLALAEGEADALVQEFAGGKAPETGRVHLDAPEEAADGSAVQIAISVESPMTAEDHVASVLLIGEGNPVPKVAEFHFSPLSGSAQISLRIRLAKTQRVLAIAKMSDGSTFMDVKTVKVAAGGC
ncbi:MAG: thiosulfate oxidation carrier protein SoxY [Hyphomicrobiales bacterium]